ncbi:Dwil\GK24137-PA-like protein [Anopheles sinensis]|uniref:Dwil\GK24137-PA-like protein n=1 Tax=Anopheles sinensis TaxID=74873 RepID=A0A084WKJ0_ANOSI|nr:Dwil\GK24137-PA-like protein [Anopheles sinensis]
MQVLIHQPAGRVGSAGLLPTFCVAKADDDDACDGREGGAAGGWSARGQMKREEEKGALS